MDLFLEGGRPEGSRCNGILEKRVKKIIFQERTGGGKKEVKLLYLE